VDTGDIQCFDIRKNSDLQRLNAVVRAVNIVSAGLVTLKTGRIGGGATCVFLR